MANVFNDTVSTNFLTSLGGSLSAGDSVYLSNNAETYVAGTDVSGTDLARIEVTPEYQSAFNITAQLNQTASGVFVNRGGHRLPSNLQGASAATVIHRVEHTPVIKTAALILGAADYAQVFADAALEVLSAADIAQLDVSAAPCVVQNGAAAVTTLRARRGARVTLRRDAGTVDISHNAELTIDFATAVNPTTTELRGGTYRVIRAPAQTGTLNFFSGLLDFSRLSVPLDLSGATIVLGDRSDLEIILPASGGDLITWGSPTLLGRDPR